MNYLALCQAVKSRVGLHGSGPSSVVSPTDVEKDIVDAVYDAWIDIQNYRTEWDWMRASATFNTVAAQTTYTPTNVGGPSNRISRYLPDTCWITDASGDKTLMYHIEYDDYIWRHANDDSTGLPYEFTIRHRDTNLIMEIPDAVYSITIDYWKTPQKLAANTDIPEMPEQFHLLIVYLAIQKLTASIASYSAGVEASQAYAVMMGHMMREKLRKKRIITRGIA